MINNTENQIDNENIKKELTENINNVKKPIGRPRKLSSNRSKDLSSEKYSNKSLSGTERVPLQTQKRIPEMMRDGYRRIWINDEYGKLEKHQLAGYTFVQKDIPLNSRQIKDETQIGSYVTKNVGRTRSSDNTTAYLMEIPVELFNKDRADYHKEIDRKEHKQLYKYNSKVMKSEVEYIDGSKGVWENDSSDK